MGQRDVLAMLATALGVVAAIASDPGASGGLGSIENVELGVAPVLTFDGVVRMNETPGSWLEGEDQGTTLAAMLFVETDAAGAASQARVTARLFAVSDERRELLSEDELPAFAPLEDGTLHARLDGQESPILANCADVFPCEERFELEIVVVDLEDEFVGVALVQLVAFNVVEGPPDLELELRQRAP